MPEKRYRQLGIKDREAIEGGLGAKQPVSAIAREIGVSTATVTREIMRNRRDDGYKGTSKNWNNANRCVKRKGCEITGLCKNCTSHKSRTCSFCAKSKCMGLCEDFVEQACVQIEQSPHVCNGCRAGGTCRLHRFRYSARDAQQMAETRGREARCGIDCTPEDIERTEAVIRAGLAKGQGIDHIYAAHRNELAFSERSFYRHVQNGTISIIPLELPRAVRYKPRKKKKGSTRTNIAPEMLAGRTYSDFMALHEDERARVVQCDCVEGTAEENCAFLTLHFVALHFQIALKLTVKDTAHVIECFAWLKDILKDDYARLFGILLFDRGCEFADVMAIERLASKGSCRAFYCDPMRSDQKGAAEKNHEELRKIVPKGTSLADIGPWELACVMSHVNSQLRDSLFGKSPMEVALAVLPQTLFDELGYRLVAPDDVVLLPRLLDEARCPSS